MANPPFSPPVFSVTIPSTKPGGGWNVYTGPQEDGPSLYANAGAVFYGSAQTSVINSKIPWASIPWEDGPNACQRDGTVIPVGTQSSRAPLGTQGAPPLPTVAVQRWLSSADYLGVDGNIYLYDRVTGTAYKET